MISLPPTVESLAVQIECLHDLRVADHKAADARFEAQERALKLSVEQLAARTPQTAIYVMLAGVLISLGLGLIGLLERGH